MKSGEQKVTYWVMYSERVQKNVAKWNEPRRIEWVVRETQHFGTADIGTAQDGLLQLQHYVDNKMHFLQSDLSGPEAHHLTEAWIEIEHRCRFDPSRGNIIIPIITAPQLGANEE
jgi:hypothetical protein